MKNIIFDFGGVLFDWNPDYLYLPYFKDEEKMNKFYSTTEIKVLNNEFDRGSSMRYGLMDLANKYPKYRKPIWLWQTEWVKMLKGTFKENVKIAKKLKKKGHTLYGLTNWSAETFGHADEIGGFFNIFENIVVSGVELTTKPKPAIYNILLSRNRLDPKDCILIEDSLPNIRTAESLGMSCVYLEQPSDLAKGLAEYDIDVS